MCIKMNLNGVYSLNLLKYNNLWHVEKETKINLDGHVKVCQDEFYTFDFHPPRLPSLHLNIIRYITKVYLNSSTHTLMHAKSWHKTMHLDMGSMSSPGEITYVDQYQVLVFIIYWKGTFRSCNLEHTKFQTMIRWTTLELVFL